MSSCLEAKVGAVSKESLNKSQRVLNATFQSSKSRMILKAFQKCLNSYLVENYLTLIKWVILGIEIQIPDLITTS